MHAGQFNHHLCLPSCVFIFTLICLITLDHSPDGWGLRSDQHWRRLPPSQRPCPCSAAGGRRTFGCYGMEHHHLTISMSLSYHYCYGLVNYWQHGNCTNLAHHYSGLVDGRCFYNGRRTLVWSRLLDDTQYHIGKKKQ